MGTYLDQYVMVAVPVPERLWIRPNPAAPEHMTYVAGFYADMDRRGLLLEDHKNPVGKLGVLYDGRSLKYCWYGAVLAYSGGPRGQRAPLEMPSMTSVQLHRAEIGVFGGWARDFSKTAPLSERPRLILVNHWH